MKKLVKESLNENDYLRSKKRNKLALLEPLAVAIKDVLNNSKEFNNVDFIDQLTDMWFHVNKEIGRSSVKESLNEDIKDFDLKVDLTLNSKENIDLLDTSFIEKFLKNIIKDNSDGKLEVNTVYVKKF